MTPRAQAADGELAQALRDLLSLFDAWIAGPLYRSGVVWDQPGNDPPAVIRARELLRRIDAKDTL